MLTVGVNEVIIGQAPLYLRT